MDIHQGVAVYCRHITASEDAAGCLCDFTGGSIEYLSFDNGVATDGQVGRSDLAQSCQFDIRDNGLIGRVNGRCVIRKRSLYQFVVLGSRHLTHVKHTGIGVDIRNGREAADSYGNLWLGGRVAATEDVTLHCTAIQD